MTKIQATNFSFSVFARVMHVDILVYEINVRHKIADSTKLTSYWWFY